jgi:catechol 2,3-dioxygenase-like lactoylglutathione lyase family enzyme
MRLFFAIAAVLASISDSVPAENHGSGPTLQPYFSAIIVRNLDTSVAWYQSLFDLRVKDRQSLPERKIRLAILESPSFLAELIEDPSALDRRKLLANSPEGTNIQGHFKIGFKVTGMDGLLKRLQILKVPVERIYTDSVSKKRNFLIQDPDGNLIQFFE